MEENRQMYCHNVGGRERLLSFFLSFGGGIFLSFTAASMAYVGSQARGPVRTVAAGLRQSHSNVGSETCL